MAPKISIVVPFYNVEDYLEECLVSLARQTLSDIEVVMVDDGSPDNCAVIAKAFAEKDRGSGSSSRRTRGSARRATPGPRTRPASTSRSWTATTWWPGTPTS